MSLQRLSWRREEQVGQKTQWCSSGIVQTGAGWGFWVGGLEVGLRIAIGYCIGAEIQVLLRSECIE